MVTILRLIHVPATPLIQTEFDLTYAEVGLITTVMFFTTGVFQVLFGAISDRIGRKIVIAAGSVAASVATILSATSVDYNSFLAWRIITGVGLSALYIPGLALIAEWFETRRMGLAMGVYHSASPFGIILISMLSTLGSVSNWRFSFYLLGFGAVMLTPLYLKLIPFRRAENEMKKNPHRVSIPSRTFLALAIMTVAENMVFVSMTAFIPTFLVGPNGLAFPTASAWVSGIYLAMTAGRPFGGILSDKFGRRVVLVLSFLSTAFLCFLLAVQIGSIMQLVVLLVWSFVLGFVTATVFAYICDSVAISIIGKTMGILSTISLIIGSLFTLVIGMVIDYAGFEAAFLLIGLAAVLGVCGVKMDSSRLTGHATS